MSRTTGWPPGLLQDERCAEIRAELAQAREVLADCATTLESYARHHAERGPEHAHKVTRNAELAARCRAALAGPSGALRFWREHKAVIMALAAPFAAMPAGRAPRPEDRGEVKFTLEAVRAPCGCQQGTCESKADRRCRMADEVKPGSGAQ